VYGGAAAAEEHGEGFRGQVDAQMQHGGQDLVGEGEPGWAAVSGIAVRGQGLGQLVQLVWGQPGQCGIGQQIRVSCRCWCLRDSGCRDGRGRLGVQDIVPVTVKGVADRWQGRHLGFTNGDSGRIGAGVQLSGDAQSGAGGGRGDGLDDDLVAGQRAASPVHGDVREEPVLDLVPLRCTGRQMADCDGQARLGGEPGELELPGPGAVAVGAAASAVISSRVACG